jgi:hypothetical protein
MFTAKESRRLRPLIFIIKCIFITFSLSFLLFLAWSDLVNVVSSDTYPTQFRIENKRKRFHGPSVFVCAAEGNMTGMSVEVFDSGLGGVHEELSQKMQQKITKLDVATVKNNGDWVLTG